MPRKSVPVSNFVIAFGRRLAELRATRGLTQDDLGKRAGLHRLSVGHIERAQHVTSLDHLEQLAAALEVTVRRLIPPSGGPPSSAGFTLDAHDLRAGDFVVGTGGHTPTADRLVVLLDGDRPVAILTPADETIVGAIEDATDLDLSGLAGRS